MDLFPLLFQVRAIRVSFVGELGWELHVPKSACGDVYRALIEAGGDRMVNAGYRAIDSLSIEKGYPHWHAEIRWVTHDRRIQTYMVLLVIHAFYGPGTAGCDISSSLIQQRFLITV